MIRVLVSSVSLGLEATRKEIISDLQTAGHGPNMPSEKRDRLASFVTEVGSTTTYDARGS